MADVTLERNFLTISQRGLLSSKTVSLSLDSLRLAYIFLPKEFKWRPAEETIRYQYINLEALSDEGVAGLRSAILLPKNKIFLNEFTFVLRDFQGQSAQVSNKDLTRGGIDLMMQLEPDRAVRGEKLVHWLNENPSVKMGDVILDSEGVRKSDKRKIPWNVLERLEFREGRYVHFYPKKGSGFSHFFARISPKELETGMAEIDFWRFLSPKTSTETSS